MARSFNGTTDQINCGSGVGNPAAISVASWFYCTGLTGNTYLGTVSRYDGTNFWTLALHQSGTLLAQVVTTGGLIQVTTTATYSLNVWTHFGFSYDSVNGLRVYINGVQDVTTGTASGTASAVTASVLLGDAFSIYPFLGYLYDAAIWNAALSAGDFSQLSRGGRPASTIGWWPLGGTASPEPDMSGFGNNGVLTGTGFAPDPIFPVPSISNLITIP